MRNLRLSLLFGILLLNIHLSAQPNPFFPMKNGVWEEAFIGIIGSPLPTYTVTCGDTLINNEVHAKMYSLFLDTLGNITQMMYQGATKTGADQVTFVPSGNQDGYLLYDFALVAGQTIELETLFGTNTLTVQSNSLMNDNVGITRRVIIFEPNPTTEIWIEGIGSSKGVLTRGVPLVADYDPFMNCFKYEDILVWSNESTNPDCEFSFTEICETTSIDDFSLLKNVGFHLFPNPMQHEMTVQIDGLELLEQPEIRIYDLQGKLIQKIDELNEEKFSFFRKNINAGMYVFELYDTKTTFALRKKIVML